MHYLTLCSGKRLYADPVDLLWLCRFHWQSGESGPYREEGGKTIWAKEVIAERAGLNPEYCDPPEPYDLRRNRLQYVPPVQGGPLRFKGVTWDRSRQKWKAQIYQRGECLWTQRFSNQMNAGLAYSRKRAELVRKGILTTRQSG